MKDPFFSVGIFFRQVQYFLARISPELSLHDIFLKSPISPPPPIQFLISPLGSLPMQAFEREGEGN